MWTIIAHCYLLCYNNFMYYCLDSTRVWIRNKDILNKEAAVVLIIDDFEPIRGPDRNTYKKNKNRTMRSKN